jgi:hypothetical protein
MEVCICIDHVHIRIEMPPCTQWRRPAFYDNTGLHSSFNACGDSQSAFLLNR